MENLKVLLSRTPYTPRKKNPFKTEILLNGEPHATVNNNMAEDMLTLLNGAYKTGVVETFGLIGDK